MGDFGIFEMSYTHWEKVFYPQRETEREETQFTSLLMHIEERLHRWIKDNFFHIMSRCTKSISKYRYDRFCENTLIKAIAPNSLDDALKQPLAFLFCWPFICKLILSLFFFFWGWEVFNQLIFSLTWLPVNYWKVSVTYPQITWEL